MRFLAFAVFILGCATLSAQSTTDWSYSGRTGPDSWGDLDPSYSACSKGREQSPVDIRRAYLNNALQPIEFHYLAGPVTMENDGHAIVVHVGPGSYIVANGVRYNLIQFDFHHPSEEAVKGDFSDMDIQFEHKSADGRLAEIAVRLSEAQDFPNATLAMLWPHLPTKAGTKVQVSAMVNPSGLLPADRSYWTYMGSLTAPPCTEGVRWFVFQSQVSISRRQLDAFAAIYKMNTRPLQSLHGRRIEASQ